MVRESIGLPPPPLQGGTCRAYGVSNVINKIGLIGLNKALAGRLVPARKTWSETCLVLIVSTRHNVGIRIFDASVAKCRGLHN